MQGSCWDPTQSDQGRRNEMVSGEIRGSHPQQVSTNRSLGECFFFFCKILELSLKVLQSRIMMILFCCVLDHLNASSTNVLKFL